MVSTRGAHGARDASSEVLLRSLFSPSSVAVYGASARRSDKLGNTLLRNLVGRGDLEVLPIHPAAATIAGVEARPHLDRPVDLALVSVPAETCEAAVADAARAGAAVAVVLSSGFGETGTVGQAHERRLRDLAAAHGTRILGPNCMGVVSSVGGVWLNASYFWAVPPRHGSIAILSQSGAFGGVAFAECRRRELGIARFASLGNSVDVNETDVLEALALDDATSVVGMFVEGFRDGRRFVDVARRVTTSKPVVVLKAGKAQSGARAAASHTGSIVGAHSAARAAFERAGVIEAATSYEFFATLDALVNLPPVAGRRLAVLTVSGGPGVLAADEADRLGFELPKPRAATIERLRRLLPGFAAIGNPIDLTPQCEPASFEAAIRAVYDDEGFDAVVAINCGLDIAEFGRGLVNSATATGRPTVAFVLDTPSIHDALGRAGILCVDMPEDAVRALAVRVGREAMR